MIQFNCYWFLHPRYRICDKWQKSFGRKSDYWYLDYGRWIVSALADQNSWWLESISSSHFHARADGTYCTMVCINYFLKASLFKSWFIYLKIFRILDESCRWLTLNGRIDETLEIIEKIARINKKKCDSSVIQAYKVTIISTSIKIE